MPQQTTQNPTTPVRVTFVPPGSAQTVEVEIDGTLTGHAAIRGLVEQVGLPPPSADLGYILKAKRTNAELALDRPLLQSGVQAGDVIMVVRSDTSAQGE